MSLQLRRSDWTALFPNAPAAIIDAFANNGDVLDDAGITQTKTRLAYALANVEHECGGFTIPNLTENINYSAKRMVEVWPGRFASEAAVKQKYGTSPGWQKKALDDIYGNRMGNRPGTNDGSTYIGRGGPQVTGRGGYREVGKRAGLDLVGTPELASDAASQPAILAAFWSWKDLNGTADAGDFLSCVKKWNGGTNGRGRPQGAARRERSDHQAADQRGGIDARAGRGRLTQPQPSIVQSRSSGRPASRITCHHAIRSAMRFSMPRSVGW